ncbi:uncharacterized protein LOC127277043 [Leptopilina boulardi]|uniref:uncharacterized protein LOC127277043 n=1 Tax=Leptopilina boulardi TaxID=63433 RepID=UPI0021F5B62C|nr:uncharacterized protein LOC127277043 [Leptopilina boulardi]
MEQPEENLSQAETVIIISDDDEKETHEPIFIDLSNVIEDNAQFYGLALDEFPINDAAVDDDVVEPVNVVWVRNASTQTSQEDFLELNNTGEDINEMLLHVGVTLEQFQNMEVENPVAFETIQGEVPSPTPPTTPDAAVSDDEPSCHRCLRRMIRFDPCRRCLSSIQQDLCRRCQRRVTCHHHRPDRHYYHHHRLHN